MTMFWSIRGGMDPTASVEAAQAKGEARATRTNLAELEARLDRTLLAW